MATTGLNQQEQPEARVGGGVSGINPYMKGYQQNPPSSAIYSSPVQPVITQASSNYGQPTSSLGYQHPTMSYPTVGIPANTGGMLPQPISTVPSQPIGFPTQPAVFNPTDISPQPSWNVTAPAAAVAPPTSGVQPHPPDNNCYNTDLAESWNDPPTLKAKKKPPKAPAPLAPITTPVMAPVAPIGQPEPQMPPTAGNPQPTPSPVQKKPPSPAAVPVMQKAPVPQEHVPMLQAFEGMLERCRGAASSTALRRKAEDVARKLAALSDLLRESKLSMEVLQGLHYIAQDLQTLNYRSALDRLNHMVSAGNFSEMSSFMPGIKALIQLGIQLRV